MDEKIDKLIKLSGNENRYQYFSLFLTLLIWINTCFLAVSIPFVEKPPEVKYINSDNKEIIEPITYEICEKYKDKFTVMASPHSSWVYDFNIYCDRTKIGLIGSFAFGGFASGALLFPVITRLLTHKPIIILSLGLFSVLLLTISFLKNYYWAIMCMLIFVDLFANFGSYSSLVLVEETISSNKRVLFGNVVNLGLSIAGIVFVALFYFLNNWLHVFYFTIGFSLLINICFLIFSYDSPRGYIAKNNLDKTLNILRGIAKFNQKLASFEEKIKEEEMVNTLKAIKENQNDSHSINQNKTNSVSNNNEISSDSCRETLTSLSSTQITAFSLVKYPSIRKKFLAFCFLFLFTNLIYNGIVIGAKNIPGNMYLNIVLLYVMEGLAYIITGFLTNIPVLGRKRTLFCMYWISSICMLTLFFSDLPNAYKLIPILIARFCVSGVFITLYTFALENYPTPVRTLGFGINATFGNSAGIIIPLVIEIVTEKMMLLIYSIILAIDSIVLMLCLTETVGKPMPESIDEISEIIFKPEINQSIIE